MDGKKPKLPKLEFLPSAKLRKNRDINAFAVGMNIVVNFGIVMAVSLFITVNCGIYLDDFFKTGYLFTFLGCLLGIFSSFRVLFKELKWLDDVDEENE